VGAAAAPRQHEKTTQSKRDPNFLGGTTAARQWAEFCGPEKTKNQVGRGEGAGLKLCFAAVEGVSKGVAIQWCVNDGRGRGSSEGRNRLTTDTGAEEKKGEKIHKS